MRSPPKHTKRQMCYLQGLGYTCYRKDPIHGQSNRELGDRVQVNDKARAEQLISQVLDLVKNQSTDVARLRQLTSDLQQVMYGLASAAYSQTMSAGGPPGRTPGAPSGESDEVIDADFKKT